MKVYIGPFTNWVGPYQIAEKILFWIPKYDEKFHTNDTVHNFGTWLAEDKNGDPSYLARFCEWIQSKKQRKVKVRIDNYDTWGMDSTLAYIILPMLKQLKATKHGSPLVDDADVPDGLGLRSTEAAPKENEYDSDDNIHRRWNWVLDEMIFAFECTHPDSNWEDSFRSGEIDFKFVAAQKDSEGKPLTYSMEDGPKHTYKCDYEGMRKVQDRIQNGLRLFGTYYSGLWD